MFSFDAAMFGGMSSGLRTAHPQSTKSAYIDSLLPVFCTILVCRKCAVRFEPICANSAFFATFVARFRAGFSESKSLIYWV